MVRGFTRLRLSEFVQISEFFQFYITDICQTSESFSKSVNLNEERAVKQSRTVPKVCRRIRMHIDCKQADSTILKVLLWIIARSRDQTKPNQSNTQSCKIHHAFTLTVFMHVLSLNAFKGQIRTFVAKRDMSRICAFLVSFLLRFYSDK